jgi:hypothetical protein
MLRSGVFTGLLNVPESHFADRWIHTAAHSADLELLPTVQIAAFQDRDLALSIDEC